MSLENITNCGSIAAKFLSQHIDGSSVFVALGELFDLCAAQASLFLPDGRNFSRILARISYFWPFFTYQGSIQQGDPFSCISNGQVHQKADTQTIGMRKCCSASC